jgi:hypothetical protein
MNVQRFRERLHPETGKYTLVDSPPERVSAEREAAEKHEYRAGFRETFAKDHQRPSVSKGCEI